MLRPLLDDGDALHAYTELLNLVLSGGLSAEELASFVASTLIGLRKPGGAGVRQIEMGDVSLRRTASRLAVISHNDVIAKYFAPIQLGLAIPNGVEIVARAVRL